MKRLAASILVAVSLGMGSGPSQAADPDTTSEAASTKPVEVSAVVRFRDELSTSIPGVEDRHRQRYRMRLGAKFWASPELEVGGRVSTGGRNDPNSGFQTFGGGFDKFEINLDRAYLAYRPDWAPRTVLNVGKFEHPFSGNPVYGALVWDDDVQPEGLALGYTALPGALDRFRMVGGVYLIQEQGSGGEASVFVLQGAGGGAWSEKTRTDAAIGYYGYSDLTPDGSLFLFDRNRGNTPNSGGTDFASGFSIIDGIVSFRHRSGPDRTYTLTLELVENMDAVGSTGSALALGGKAELNAWRLFYQWQRVERDAVLSLFAQDDFIRTTAFRGHVFGARYTASHHIGVQLWALGSEALLGPDSTPAGDSEWRIRLDLDLTP